MIRLLARLTALSCLLLAPLAAAQAQIGDSSQPLDTIADRIENLDDQGRTVLTGHVDITQGDRRIMADRVELVWTQPEDGSRGDIERVVATGHVRYFSPFQNATGDLGVYEMGPDTITLTGDVVITQGENVITTTRFVSNLTSGNSNFGEEGNGTPVRAVIYPRRTEPAPATGNGNGTGGR
ncbi:LptA/OstA family protein [Maricaulis salignorans]|uniref:Lipopolysaccharide export system protein LptA n=1 Tax=Maricaulis salignorans TaxID=144026 RepID=A0A1G9SQN0_9PROT|nr:LptA/OstA family protein [Maricaulis salignorans]SDM37768.1 lipopolysaccharide export system protein LptA [Maricaulis salignorans]